MSSLAWHFVRTSGLLLDNQMVTVGETYRVAGRLKLCERGLHASERLIDALRYAPGPILCRVQVGGTIVRDTDKLVASERTVLWMADITATLREFACDVADEALDVAESRGLHVAAASRAAVQASRRYLRGELDIEALRTARDAAWVARNEAWQRYDSRFAAVAAAAEAAAAEAAVAEAEAAAAAAAVAAAAVVEAAVVEAEAAAVVEAAVAEAAAAARRATWSQLNDRLTAMVGRLGAPGVESAPQQVSDRV
jgi:hypothetical protein